MFENSQISHFKCYFENLWFAMNRSVDHKYHEKIENAHRLQLLIA